MTPAVRGVTPRLPHPTPFSARQVLVRPLLPIRQSVPWPGCPAPRRSKEVLLRTPIASCLPFIGLAACGSGEIDRADFETLPAIAPAPADNPITADKIELGRLLFWDPVLSGHEDVACATCHHPAFGYGDGLALSIGAGGVGLGPDRQHPADAPFVKRNAQTVLNSGFNGWGSDTVRADPAEAPMFWDNRTASLEAQALEPIRSDVEMRGNAYTEEDAVDTVVDRLAAIPGYVALFAEVFGEAPDEAVNARNLGRALATFERHLSRPSSPYDAWLAGDDDALDADELRGLEAFHDVGCAECHAGPMFSDFELHDIGVEDAEGTPDDGDGTNQFRTPTLRNIEVTGPYMHSGAENELEDAIEFYDDLEGDDIAPEAQDLDVDDVEEKIEAFLLALTDDFDADIPAAVPSGLPPGGALVP